MSHTKKARTEEQDFAPKNILITGGAGFIASHVVRLLGTFAMLSNDRSSCSLR